MDDCIRYEKAMKELRRALDVADKRANELMIRAGALELENRELKRQIEDEDYGRCDDRVKVGDVVAHEGEMWVVIGKVEATEPIYTILSGYMLTKTVITDMLDITGCNMDLDGMTILEVLDALKGMEE